MEEKIKKILHKLHLKSRAYSLYAPHYIKAIERATEKILKLFKEWRRDA